jgi:hypothetical protein
MENGYLLNYPPLRWEEGLLLGNGTVGAIAMGGTARETLILSHERIYAPVFDGFGPPAMAKELPDIRRLIAEGRYAESARVPDRLMDELYHYDGQIWTNPFMPACDIILQIPDAAGPVSDYSRSLDFSTGLGIVGFKLDGVTYKREFFVSRRDGAGVIRLRSDRPANYILSLGKHPEDNPPDWATVFYKKPCLTEPEITADGVDISFSRAFTGRRGQFYTCKLRVVSTDGVCRVRQFRDRNRPAQSDSLSVSGAREALILFSLVRDHEEDPILHAVQFSYEESFKRHAEAHGGIYKRLSLNLDRNGAGSDDAALWAEARNAEFAPPEFLSKIFSAGRYAIISATGKTPPNLQGIWTGKYGVGWSGDYTNDGNIQVAILSMLPSGFFEGMESVFDYLEGYMDEFRYNAKRLYGTRGIHVPCRTSDSGLAFHFAERYPMLFWIAGAAWFSHFYYDYWLYTQDDDFFRNRALPFMKEAALFYEDYLFEDPAGHWVFSPSYSPENTPANSDSPVCVNATMDIACAMELFTSLITACRTLGIEEENVLRWKEILGKMPPYLIGEDGTLKEWASPLFEENQDHRHSSHLYMLYSDIPGDFRKNRTLMAAARKAYEVRMEKRIQSRGAMAFGLIQCGMTAAHLGDPHMVGVLLSQMTRNNYYPTFASSHDAGPKIFNTDISGGVPALMLEALAQSSPVTDSENHITSFSITLLPALPESMASGSVTGLRLRGGYSLDMQWRDRKVIEYHIDGPGRKPYTVTRSSP